MMGLVFCCGISSGMTPIAHVFPLMAMEYYHTAAGASISYAGYMLFAVPVGLLAFAAMLLLFRFVLKPDVAGISVRHAAALRSTLPQIQNREKLVLAVFFLVTALWVLPSLVQPVFPEFSAFWDKMGTAFPPLLGVILLSVMEAEGRPLLPFSEAMAKGVPWASLFMCCATLAVGSAMTNQKIGLTVWLSEHISPLAASMPPMALVLLFAFWAAVQTNLSSNMVTVTVVTAVAVPVCLAVPAVSAPAVAALIGLLASYAFATPPAMPCVAIAGSSGWTTAGSLVQYGFLLMLISVLLCAAVGYPIAAVIL